MAVLDSLQAGRQIGQGGNVSGVSKGLDIAFQSLLQRLMEKRQSRLQTEQLAQKTVLEDNPAAAYSILGMEAPTDSTVQPPGTELSEVTRRRGQTTTSYKAPDKLDMTKAFSLYNDYRIRAEEKNALFGSAVKGYKPIVVPDFPAWLKSSGILSIMEKQGKETNGKVETTTTKQETPQISADQVLMKAPDGRSIPVHKSRIEEAKKRGLKTIK